MPYTSPYSPPTSLLPVLEPHGKGAVPTAPIPPPFTPPLEFPSVTTPFPRLVGAVALCNPASVPTVRVDVGPQHVRRGEHHIEDLEQHGEVIASKPAAVPAGPISTDTVLSSDVDQDVGQGGICFGDRIDQFEGSMYADRDTHGSDASSESSEEHNPQIDFHDPLSESANNNIEVADDAEHGADTPNGSQLDDEHMYVQLEREFNQYEDTFVLFSDRYAAEDSVTPFEQPIHTGLGPLNSPSRSSDDHDPGLAPPQPGLNASDREGCELGLCNSLFP
jgi:hypothetical protein